MVICPIILLLFILYAYTITFTSKWKYSTEFIDDWYINTQNWDSYNISIFPNKTNNILTYYYQNIFSPNYIDNLLYYIFDITFNGGIIIYINGHQISQLYLPIESNITTSPEQNDIKTVKFKLLPYYMIIGNNMISIEVHTENYDGHDPFDVLISEELSIEDCLKLTYPQMTIFDNRGNFDFFEGVERLVDDTVNQSKFLTYFDHFVWVRMYFNYSTSFNKYTFVLANDVCQRDPKIWEIKGLINPNIINKDHSNLISLNDQLLPCEIVNTNLRSNPWEPFTFYLNSTKSYFGLELNIIKIRDMSHNRFQLSKLIVFGCKVNKCQNTNELPIGYERSKYNYTCEFGGNYSLFECQNNGEWNVISESQCYLYSPSSFKYSDTNILNLTYGQYYQSDNPILTGMFGDYTRFQLLNNYEFPNDISINNQNGIISGNPNDFNGKYKIKIKSCNGKTEHYCIDTELVIYIDGNPMTTSSVTSTQETFESTNSTITTGSTTGIDTDRSHDTTHSTVDTTLSTVDTTLSTVDTIISTDDTIISSGSTNTPSEDISTETIENIINFTNFRKINNIIIIISTLIFVIY